MTIREIILDTETTGLDVRNGHRIIEIGAVEVIGKVITGKKFHCYINPQRNVPSDAYNVHGISTEFLRNKPIFSKIADEFLDFVGESVLVIHNAPFDIKFLNYELSLLNKPSFNLSNAIDTLKIARDKFPGQKVNLDALCKRYKIDSSFRVFHGALKDAELLAKVYLNLVEHSEQRSFGIIVNGYDPQTHKPSNQSLSGATIKNIRPTELELSMHAAFVQRIKQQGKI